MPGGEFTRWRVHQVGSSPSGEFTRWGVRQVVISSGDLDPLQGLSREHWGGGLFCRIGGSDGQLRGTCKV